MKKTLLALAMVAMLSCSAYAQTTTDCVTIDVDALDTGEIFNGTFAMGAMDTLDSISVDLATTWGGDLEITLTAPDGTVYTPMFDDVNDTGSGNFDLGVAAGSNALADVATYTFEATGAAWTGAFADAALGPYAANTWGTGGPHAAGDWTLLITDDAGGDATSVGDFCVTHTLNVVPEPASATLLLAGFGFAALRRRR